MEMNAIDVGRVCIATKGRHAGEKIVVMKLDKGKIAYVLTSKGKEKKANIRHLFPLKKILEVTENKKDLMEKLKQVKIE